MDNAMIRWHETFGATREEPPRGWVVYLTTGHQKAERQHRYAIYRLSAQWQLIRHDALARAGYRCQLCAAPDTLDVHHITYAHIGLEQPEDLRVLCRRCHTQQHLTGVTPIALDPVSIARAALQERPAATTRKGAPNMLCEAITKRGVRCPTLGAWVHPESGQWLCHVHNPNGVYRRQVEAFRSAKKA